MTTMTRKQLFAAGGVGAIGVVAGSAALASVPPEDLDTTFQRAAEPTLAFDYPSDWNVYDQLIEDLVRPIQVVSLSAKPILPHRSLDESGFPDHHRVGSKGLLLTIYAETYEPGADYARGLPLSSGVAYEKLEPRDEAPADQRWFSQWFNSGRSVYTLFLLHGDQTEHLTTARAVLETVRSG